MSICARIYELVRLKTDAHRSDNNNNKECIGKTEFENNWGLKGVCECSSGCDSHRVSVVYILYTLTLQSNTFYAIRFFARLFSSTFFARLAF